MDKKEIVITPKELRESKIIYKKICLEKTLYSVILGKATYENMNPMKDAVVMLYTKNISKNCSCMNYLGYTKTDFNGVFVISIEIFENVDYIIEIYEPLRL